MQAMYYDWVAFHARRSPMKIALMDSDGQMTLSYAELDTRVQKLAAALQREYCVQPGDSIMVLARTGPQAFEIQFACARLGAIFLPVNWRLTLPELSYIAADAKPVVILHEKEFEENARELAKAGNVGALTIDAPGGSSVSEYERLIRNADSACFVLHKSSWEATWILLYTSGTTGRPKGAMLSYRMMYFNAMNFIPSVKLGSDTKFLCAMPTFHTGGLNCYANPVLFCGGTVITMRDFDADKALDLMTDRGVGLTHFFGVPSMYLMMSQLHAFEDATFPAMKIAGLGGAPASTTLVRAWMTKGIPFQPAYGMTEIGPAITIMNEERLKDKVGSSGQPVMNLEFRIVTPDEKDAKVGEIGEIRVKGPVLLSGYWNLPEESAKSLSDGWFRTGDAAWMDDEGYVFIVDRYKDMYISGGENVYPTEVENVISAYKDVLAAAVIGIPDARWGEVGCAFIVPKAEKTIDEEALMEHCRNNLAKYKLPKSVHIVDALPRTASGKVLKGELRKTAAELLVGQEWTNS